MWFKNLRIFRLNPDCNLETEPLLQALEQQRFHPVGSQDMQSIGWVSPGADLPLALTVENQILLCAQTEKKLLPAAVINQVAREQAQELEAEQGFRPGRKQMQEIKDEVTMTLLPRAFSVQRQTHVWLDTTNRWLVIDAAAQNTADEILSLLGETLSPFPALPLQTEYAPAALLTQWLLDEEDPLPFSLDDDAELRAKQDQRAVIRYVRHPLDKELIRQQIEQGMYCSRLGLTWADRISFVLNENLELRRVSPLDILTDEQNQPEHDAQEELSATFLLMCEEFNALLNQLLTQLGGEKIED